MDEMKQGAPSKEEKEWLAEVSRVEANNEAHNELVLYQHTGDGRCVWRAISILFEADIPIPRNIHAKLHEWSQAISQATNENLARGLELVGDEKKHLGPSLTNKAYARVKLASEVRQVADLYKISITEAMRVVARNSGLKFPNVKRTYHRVFQGTGRKPKDADPNPLSTAIKGWKVR